MPSSLYVPVLITGMILTGACNSLWSKFQDMQCVENCSDPNPRNHVLYEQPVWQTLQMFIGEMLCFLPVAYTWLASRRQSASVQLPEEDDESLGKQTGRPLRGWNILLMWLPAAFDLTGTTLMNIGLLYTPVSIYQMTRGALVLFVGIFSVLFLHRRLWLYQWVSLITVMAGVSIVGLSGSLVKDTLKEDSLLARAVSIVADAFVDPSAPVPIDTPQTTNVLVGVFFILFAQIFTASQFVVEEKIMSRFSVTPLVAVGLEGFFGALTVILFVPILSIPSVTAKSTFFDLPRGWHQMIDNSTVLWSGLIVAVSIGFFNFFGLSVTRHVSATARSLTDTCRTLAIWIVSLGLGWEKLLWPVSVLQVAGFGLLVYGTFLFNDLVKAPPCLPHPSHAHSVASEGLEATNDEETALLAESLDETAVLPAGGLGQGGFDVVPPGEHAQVKTKRRAE